MLCRVRPFFGEVVRPPASEFRERGGPPILDPRQEIRISLQHFAPKIQFQVDLSQESLPFQLERGETVSGSDRVLSPLAERVREAGAKVYQGHAAENVRGADVVVRSSAVPEDNVEVAAAKEAGIPVTVRLTPKDIKWLDKKAKKLGAGRREVVEMLIRCFSE